MRKLIIAASLAMLVSTSAMAHDHEADAILSLMMATFDKPDNHLAVDPIIVSGDWALASWSQGEMGGRAVLKQKDGKWVIHLCAGDSLKDAKTLSDIGIDPTAAETMAAELATVEAKVDPARVALFSKFEGVVVMDGSQ